MWQQFCVSFNTFACLAALLWINTACCRRLRTLFQCFMVKKMLQKTVSEVTLQNVMLQRKNLFSCLLQMLFLELDWVKSLQLHESVYFYLLYTLLRAYFVILNVGSIIQQCHESQLDLINFMYHFHYQLATHRKFYLYFTSIGHSMHSKG